MNSSAMHGSSTATTPTNMGIAASVLSTIRAYVVQSPVRGFRGHRILVPTLWLGDTIATALFVSAGGNDLEANPIVRYVLEAAGVWAFIALKLAILVFWLTLATRIRWQVHAVLATILFPIVCMGIHLVISL